MISFDPRPALWLTPQVALKMEVDLPADIRCVVSVRLGQSSSRTPSVGGRGTRDPVGLELASVAVAVAVPVAAALARPRLGR